MNWSRRQRGRRQFRIRGLEKPDFHTPAPSLGSQISKLRQEKHTLQTSELKKTQMHSCGCAFHNIFDRWAFPRSLRTVCFSGNSQGFGAWGSDLSSCAH